MSSWSSLLRLRLREYSIAFCTIKIPLLATWQLCNSEGFHDWTTSFCNQSLYWSIMYRINHAHQVSMIDCVSGLPSPYTYHTVEALNLGRWCNAAKCRSWPVWSCPAWKQSYWLNPRQRSRGIPDIWMWESYIHRQNSTIDVSHDMYSEVIFSEHLTTYMRQFLQSWFLQSCCVVYVSSRDGNAFLKNIVKNSLVHSLYRWAQLSIEHFCNLDLRIDQWCTTVH